MSNTEKPSPILFWGCFLALITTGFAFVGRLELLGVWGKEFELDAQQLGILAGIGIWPFAVSIIFFSLFIDKVGYKAAMLFALVCHLIWAALGVMAYFTSAGGDKDTAYKMLVGGSLIAALGNGSVEAFINPVVATIYSKEKTKWLNILHAAWPGGLVIMGVIVILLEKLWHGAPWAVNVGIIAIPAIIYGLMLIGQKFPVSERVASGVSYRDMLAEFGAFGAFITGTLVALQVIIFGKETGILDVSFSLAWIVSIIIGIVCAVAMGLYTKSFGSWLMALLIIIMAPLATTEIGTDGWITNIMAGFAEEKGFHPVMVLVYTSAIMLVLRFFAGPIVKVLTPLGLLIVSAVLAVLGLIFLSQAQTFILLLGAATLYGLGKTFFWPTTLGVVAEQTPRGGALTLNAISGIGMLACGALGFPLLGKFQIDTQKTQLAENSSLVEKVPAAFKDGAIATVTENDSIFGKYTGVDTGALDKAIDAATKDDEAAGLKATAAKIAKDAPKLSLAKIALFPAFMLLCYIGLFVYFKSRGGYKPIDLSAEGGH
ncbi:MAG: MFS transporter [Verrucomicrobiota bacterium]